MGPDSRRGPAKNKKEKRDKMNKAIEDAVSEAMTDDSNPTVKAYRERSFMDKAKEYIGDKREMLGSALEGRPGIRTFRAGGEVRTGDVRDNPKRGKCY